MNKIQLGRYGKFATAAVGLFLTVASTRYASTDWFPYVVAAASALGVYGVPNSPKQLEITGTIEQHAGVNPTTEQNVTLPQTPLVVTPQSTPPGPVT